MNKEEDTLDTNSGFIITVRSARINYVGPKEEEKPKKLSKAHRMALSKARQGKKFGPRTKGESK